MALRGKERAALRAAANRLQATVHAGQHGITPAVIASLDDALRTHELVKVQVARLPGLDAKDAARMLAEATNSDVVQVIGKTVTVYREKTED